jgi:raffinose/stachyose/melibiose transport system substrate-binding protein
VAAALAASSAAHAVDTVVTIRTWSPIIETSTKMAAATEAKIPGVKLEYKVFNYPDYIVDLQTHAASGEMSDLIGLEPGALARQYQDFLMPLQDCAIKAWGADWKDKFYRLAIDQIRLGNDKGRYKFLCSSCSNSDHKSMVYKANFRKGES